MNPSALHKTFEIEVELDLGDLGNHDAFMKGEYYKDDGAYYRGEVRVELSVCGSEPIEVTQRLSAEAIDDLFQYYIVQGESFSNADLRG